MQLSSTHSPAHFWTHQDGERRRFWIDSNSSHGRPTWSEEEALVHVKLEMLAKSTFRAGGLVEGYLGSDVLNRQKYLPKLSPDPNSYSNRNSLLVTRVLTSVVKKRLCERSANIFVISCAVPYSTT